MALLYAKVPGVSAVYRDEYKVRNWIRKFPANVTWSGDRLIIRDAYSVKDRM